MQQIRLYLFVLIYSAVLGLLAAIFEFKFDLIGFTFLIVSFQLVVLISKYSARNTSLVLVYFVFTFIFLNLLPWLHYSHGILIFAAKIFSFDMYLAVNSLIFASNLLIYSIGKIDRDNLISSKPQLVHERLSRGPAKWVLLSLSLLGFFITFALNDFSIESLLFRGLVDEIRSNVIDSLALILFLGSGGRMLTFFAFVYGYTRFKDSSIFKSLLFIILIVTIFPTGVPRYMVGMVYLPLALLFIPKLRSGGSFAALLIFSLMLIFPFLDQFRSFSTLANLRLIPPIEFFYAAHFDAYENMATAIDFEFVTYGRQLIGVLLFYFPRAFWSDKPIGSGSQMAEDIGYSFSNIAMPFLAEGYVNFGVFGVFLFALAFAYFASRLDGFFRFLESLSRDVDYPSVFYFYLLGSLFFMLRGDLLSSVAYTSAGIFIAFFVNFLMKRFK